MHLQDFDFALPVELIAQEPAARRDHARLMVVDRARQQVIHDVFHNVGAYLQAGDVLVVNDTRVLPARLYGRKVESGGRIEVFLLHELRTGVWEVLLKPAARAPHGTVIEFGAGILQARIIERLEGGTRVMQFTPAEIYTVLDQCGEVPLPPYIKRPAGASDSQHDRERYQTVYAQHPGAVAAPTAGLHFTPALLTALAQRGLHRAAVTLHVGWGTFQPIRTEQVTQHQVAREFYRLTAAEAAVIQQAQKAGGQVVAVGTTTTRTLETIVQQTGGLTAASGWTGLFIYPGYRFQAVDTLITNFHLPRSSLFLLVCAFAGRDLMLEAYRIAMAARYRFYSYGDAMLIR